MKKMKKILALVLAVVMAMSMSMVGLAAQADLTGHTYTAYQIFSGTQSTDGAWLGNIAWGSGINSTQFLKDLQDSTYFGDRFDGCTTVSSVADIVGLMEDNSQDAIEFAKIAYNNKTGDGIPVEDNETSLEAGYYLIVDTTEDANVKNLALLQLTKSGTFDIQNKTSVPEVVKKVKEKDDSTNKTTEWQDGADYDIGDNVPFQLTATLGEYISVYKTYEVIFHDTLSAGLTYNNDAKITIDGKNVTESFTKTSNGTTLEFKCDDVIALGAKDGSIIIVEYTAQLNSNAKLGSAGNPNTVYLEYSNNPNADGSGDTGETPTDTVIVFTYGLTVNKVENELDNDGNKTGKTKPIAGAEFVLYKYDPENPNAITEDSAEDDEIKYIGYVELELNVSDDGTVFSFSGLDAGKYILREKEAPAGYNKAEDTIFAVVSEYDTNNDTPKFNSLDVKDTNGNTISSFTITSTSETSNISTDIVNNRGGILPETGGIGTTIFYILGTVLVLGAGIILITKKRMDFEK